MRRRANQYGFNIVNVEAMNDKRVAIFAPAAILDFSGFNS